MSIVINPTIRESSRYIGQSPIATSLFVLPEHYNVSITSLLAKNI